jgi:hypothetical protein
MSSKSFFLAATRHWGNGSWGGGGDPPTPSGGLVAFCSRGPTHPPPWGAGGVPVDGGTDHRIKLESCSQRIIYCISST